MKKCILFLAALCLLLVGCGAPPSAPAEKPAAVAPATYYEPYYADPSLDGLQADVIYSSDSYTRLGRLNNGYRGWAQGVYDALGVAKLEISQLAAPDLRYVRVAFSTAAGEGVETFTLYENNFVLAQHPKSGTRRCITAPGTYEAVLAYLDGVAAEQSRYFALSDEHTDEDGYHQASYALYDEKGKTVVSKKTATVTATVELIGEGIVRVIDPDGTRVYAPHEGKRSVLSHGPTALFGDYLAVTDAEGVAVYSLFGSQPLCRTYVAAGTTVQGLDFSADGETLHVLVRNAEGTLYDRTLSVQDEIDGTVFRILGDWRSLLTPATEKEEQITAYNILKKLRHREKELGFYFSGILMGHLAVRGKDYFLCEIGHWITTEDGGVGEYEVVGYLLVPPDLSVGYAVEMEEDELRWDTADNWFKK